ncbi:MAG: tetratricopeptide repeat protein [Deltaproteobacteria bacterium]|nr:tetratricopeptide repeat protein [Deltaproteobacteria bacterium]
MKTQTPLAENPARSAALICLALVLAVFAVYGPSLHHGFAPLDDDEYVTANAQVLSGLTPKGMIWAFSFNDHGYWHPLTWLSHQLDIQIWGLHPAGHHLTNVLLHVASVLLLFFILNSLTGALWKSAMVAALFAVHPLNVESVVWVASRKNLLSTLFWMLTIFAYVRYAKKLRYSDYLLAFLGLALGLMAKPMLVTLPLVLLLLDYWPLGRIRPNPATRDPIPEVHGSSPRSAQPLLGQVLIEKLPFAALAGASVVVSFLSAQSRNIVVPGESVPMLLRFENALVSYVTYLFKMLWPTDLALFYPFPDAIPFWQWAGAGILVGLGTGVVFWKARNAPFLFVGWFWYLVTLLPVIGLVQQGLWPAWSDRFAYVPLIGPFVLLSWGVPSLLSKTQYFPGKRLAALACAAVLALGISSWQQVRLWSDSEGILRHSVKAAPKGHLTRFNLACLLLSKGRAEEAIAEFKEATRILPLNPAFHHGLGTALLTQGKYAEAAQHLKAALKIKPDYPEALVNLGSALRQLGEVDEASAALHGALKLKALPAAHHNLGLLLAAEGRFREAIVHYEQALRLKPSDVRIHNDLAAALYSLGEPEKAMAHLSEALRLSPDDFVVRRNYDFIRRQLETRGENVDTKRTP